MKNILPTLLSGYIYISILEKILTNECSLHANTIRQCNCLNEPLKEIPQLSNCEIFDLSGSEIQSVHTTSFLNSLNMKALIMHKTRIIKMNVKFLQPLLELNTVNFSNSHITYLDNIIWPPNITLLNLSNTGLIKFNSVHHLSHLKFIYLDHNELTGFPKFDQNSPIEILNLDNNPNLTVLANDVIPYCELKNININSLTRINGASDFCECQRLANWLTRHNIRHNLEPCETAKNRSCTTEYSPEALNKYINCLGPNLNANKIASVSGIFLMTAVVSLYFYRKHYARHSTSPEIELGPRLQAGSKHDSGIKFENSSGLDSRDIK